LWAEIGEKEITENTKEVYPGLIVAGMVANAVFAPEDGSYLWRLALARQKGNVISSAISYWRGGKDV